MKTQTGYIYPESISAERKPELNRYADEPEEFNQDCLREYEFDVKEWQKTLIQVKNAYVRQDYIMISGYPSEILVTPGTKVEHNKGTVIKIL